MKRGLVWPAAIAFGAVAVFAPRAVHAACVPGYLAVFPENETPLPTNGRLVLEGYGDMRQPVASLASSHLELRAPDDIVPLRVVETHVGAMQLTQVVLVPMRKLRPNTHYIMPLPEPPRRALPMIGNEDPFDAPIHADRVFEWTTADGVDQSAPRWKHTPQANATVYRKLGCGPEAYIRVSVPMADAEPAQIRVDIRPATGGKASRYLVTPEGGFIQVGHEMCAGPFRLKNGQRYLVTLTAIDPAGNETPAPGGRLEIVGPGPQDEHR